jgi:hypothetical protein
VTREELIIEETNLRIKRTLLRGPQLKSTVYQRAGLGMTRQQFEEVLQKLAADGVITSFLSPVKQAPVLILTGLTIKRIINEGTNGTTDTRSIG